MKRIIAYRKLLNITPETDLNGLKSTYRSLMKEWHPDKFTDNEALRDEAEEKSKEIIEAYHFLVSISPETKAFNLEAYTQTTTISKGQEVPTTISLRLSQETNSSFSQIK